MRIVHKIAAFLTLALCGQPLWAAITLSGSGFGPNGQAVSASATFTVTGNTLTVELANTGAATQSNGSVITGVMFDIEPDLVGPLNFNAVNNPALTAGNNIYIDGGGNGSSQNVQIANTTTLGGSYTSSLTNPALGDFGVATTGGNGLFAAGPITLGNGGPNYGIVAPGTFPTGPDGSVIWVGNSGPNSLPFVQSSVTFTFTFTGTLLEEQIVSARFMVGTAGDYFPTLGPPSPTPEAAPEPASLALWSLGLGAAAMIARRRSARPNRAS